MPQIYAIIGPSVRDQVIPKLEELDRLLSAATIEVLGKEVSEDVAFTAVVAVYTRGEADLQVEIRLTAGEDEYGTGQVFEPTQEQWDALAEMFAALVESAVPIASFSFWPKPYLGTKFRFFKFKE